MRLRRRGAEPRARRSDVPVQRVPGIPGRPTSHAPTRACSHPGVHQVAAPTAEHAAGSKIASTDAPADRRRVVPVTGRTRQPGGSSSPVEVVTGRTFRQSGRTRPRTGPVRARLSAVRDTARHAYHLRPGCPPVSYTHLTL